MARCTLAFMSVLALFVLSSNACKTPASAGPADTDEETRAAGAEASAGAAEGSTLVALVYTPGAATGIGEVPDPGRTAWYEVSDAGLIKIAEVEGRVSASRDGKLWRVGVRTSEVEMMACGIDQEDGGDTIFIPLRLNEPTIARLGGEARMIASALAEGVDPRSESAFECAVHSAYQLGDFLFVNFLTYEECGAHPSYSIEPRVVSLRDGSIQKLGVFTSGLSGLDDERAAAFAGMDAELVMDEESALVPTVFRVDLVEGTPTLKVQMTAGTSYVSHDGSWDSYSMSQVVEVKGGAPAPLATALDVPAPLLELFVQRGKYLDHSLFEVPAGELEELLGSFRSVE